MKRILTMVFAGLAAGVFAADWHVDSASGDDAAGGSTPKTAWRTLSRVNQADEVKFGDRVLFRRGGLWRGTVAACAGVTYGAYGEGEKPRLYGSPADGADPAKWRRTDNPRVWAYAIGHDDVGTLVFDGGAQHAVKIICSTDPKTGRRTNMTTGRPFVTYRDLDTDLHFWHDYYENGTGEVYLYSERNPGERFASIEFNVKCCGFRVGSASDVTVDGFDVRYVGVHGVSAGTCTNLTVRNCSFTWIGGSIQAEVIFGRNHPTRLGNGVEIYGGCENYLVSNCVFRQIYDAGATHQFNIPDEEGTRRYDQRHVRYLDNVFENCNYSIEYFLSAPEGNASRMEDVLIAGNTMKNAGRGFCEQRNDLGIAAHLKARYRADRNRATNFVVRDNVFDGSRDMLVHACAALKNEDGSSSLPRFERNTFVGQKGDYFGTVSEVSDDLVVFDETTEAYVNGFGEGNRCLVKPSAWQPVDQTAELQARIDALARTGGTLVLTPGLYRSGALFFRPGVNLCLERGAVLRGVDDAAGYPMRETRIEGETCLYYPALVNADGCDGFTVSGEGVIDGHGLPTWNDFWALRRRKPNCTNKELMRPRLFYVSNSKNVEVSGITFKNAKFWTTHYYRCANLKIHDVHIVSETIGGVKGPSTDAIDLDNCRDVTISRVRMDVNDDGVAIKGGKGPWADDPGKCPGNGPTTNVLVEDCVFGPGCHSCLTLGSECPAATNVVLRNCRVERAGNILNLKMRADTPQHYENLLVSNVTGRCHTVLNVRAWNQFFDLKGRKDPPKSYANDVRFADCDFTCSHERNIVPTPGFEVTNVSFVNVRTEGALAWPADADTPAKRRAALEAAWRPNGAPYVQPEDGLRCTPLTDGTRTMRRLENVTNREVTEIYEGYVSTLDPETGRIEATDEARLAPGATLYVIGDNIWRYEGKSGLRILAPTNGETVVQLRPVQRKFAQESHVEREKYFDGAEASKALRTDGTKPQPVVCSWQGNATNYAVVVRRLPDGKVFHASVVSTNVLHLDSLEIGRDWQLSVTGGGESAAVRFKTEDLTPRLLWFNGTANCRDIGGYRGLDGRRIRQGLVFRTEGLNSNAPVEYYSNKEILAFEKSGQLEKMGKVGRRLHELLTQGKKLHERPSRNRLVKREKYAPGERRLSEAEIARVIATYGIRSDIDLRNDSECYGMSGSPLGPSVTWFHYPYIPYSETFVEGQRETNRKVFKVFLDKKNYPIDFHCIGGADRTGTVAMLLEALLGVCEDDLWRDYLTTGFAGTVGDAEHQKKFASTLAKLKEYPGETLAQKAEAFFRTIDYSDDDIRFLREYLLEPLL